MSELEQLFKLLTNKGLLNVKKIVNYAFPSHQQSGPKITDKLWLKAIALLAPLLALILLPILGCNPPYFFTISPHLGALFHLIILGYAAFFTLFFLICSLILKAKNRSPTLFLILSAVAPIKAFLLFTLMNFIFTFSGFEQMTKEIVNYKPTPGQKKKEERLDRTKELDQIFAKYAANEKAYKEQRKAREQEREARAKENEKVALENQEKRREAEKRRIEERDRESLARSKRMSEDSARRREKMWEEWENRNGIHWMTRKEVPKEEAPQEPTKPFEPKTYTWKTDEMPE